MAMRELATVRDSEIWKVEGTFEERLAVGVFSVYTVAGVTYAQVGPIQWPLTKQTPCLKPARGSYVFALHDGTEQIHYVVNLPTDAADAVLEALDATLRSCTAFQVSDIHPAASPRPEHDEPEGGQTTTDKIVSGIGKAAVYAAQGLAVGATAISKKIKQGADKYKGSTEACESPKPVDEKTKARVETAKAVAKTASKITGAAIEAAAGLASSVATAIISSSKDKDKDLSAAGSSAGQSVGQSAKAIGAATLVAAAEVYEAMDEAFKLVARTAAKATAEVVEHKYGKDYGDTAYDAMSAAGHSAEAYTAMRKMGRKTVLKVAKNTASSSLESSGAKSSQGGKLAMEGA